MVRSDFAQTMYDSGQGDSEGDPRPDESDGAHMFNWDEADENEDEFDGMQHARRRDVRRG